MPSKIKRRTQPTDVWALDLVTWDDENGGRAEEEELAGAAATLTRMAPAIAGLDRSRCHADLYISTMRDDDWGGLELPASIVVAAGLANLELHISIMVLLPQDDETDDKQT